MIPVVIPLVRIANFVLMALRSRHGAQAISIMSVQFQYRVPNVLRQRIRLASGGGGPYKMDDHSDRRV